MPAALACSLFRVGPFVIGMMLSAVERCCWGVEGANADTHAMIMKNLTREASIFLITIIITQYEQPS